LDPILQATSDLSLTRWWAVCFADTVIERRHLLNVVSQFVQMFVARWC